MELRAMLYENVMEQMFKNGKLAVDVPEKTKGSKFMKIKKWNEINENGTPKERLEAFLESSNDCYAIFQLKRTDETALERFASKTELERKGIEPNFDHYEVVYIAPYDATNNQLSLLENLYEKFNLYLPEDFKGHSLSVSDIVALKQNGVVSCYYVDSIGFKELPKFLQDQPTIM